MKIPPSLQDARLNITKTAELISMHAGHLRRLIRLGIFPAPRRTAKGMPYYDHALLNQVADVLRRGVGVNGQEVAFYSRKPTAARKGRATKRQEAETSPLIGELLNACRQVGLDSAAAPTSRVASLLRELFPEQQPTVAEAAPAIIQHLIESQRGSEADRETGYWPNRSGSE